MISGLELLLLISAGVIILGLITIGTFILRRTKECRALIVENQCPRRLFFVLIESKKKILEEFLRKSDGFRVLPKVLSISFSPL